VTVANTARLSILMLRGEQESDNRKSPSLEAKAVTLYVFRIGEHPRRTDALFVLASIFFPILHVIKPGGKISDPNPLDNLSAATLVVPPG